MVNGEIKKDVKPVEVDKVKNGEIKKDVKPVEVDKVKKVFKYPYNAEYRKLKNKIYYDKNRDKLVANQKILNLDKDKRDVINAKLREKRKLIKELKNKLK